MKHIGSKIALLVALLSFLVPRASASENLRGIFTEYDTSDGLAHNNIHDIYTDSQGYVWLCTWCGVSRFDGHTFRNYCTDPKSMSVRHNRFRGVEEDGVGNLWFRTYDDHVYRFNRQNEEFEDLCHSIEEIHGHNYRVDSFICSAGSNTVWVEYEGFGVVAFSSDAYNQLIFTNYIGNPAIGRDISQMIVDDQGQLWFSSERGVGVITAEGEVKEIIPNPTVIVDMVATEESVAFVSKDEIWVYEPQGLTQTHHIHFPQSGITTIAFDKGGNRLYVGTSWQGVYEVSLAPQQLHHFTKGDLPTKIRDLFVDSYGTIWITEARHGITRLDTAKGNYKHFQQKQHTVQFYTGTNSLIIEREGVVWIKMSHVGFGYYDREKDCVEPFYNDPSYPDCRMSNGVAIFEIDDQNVLWLSNYYERGLVKVVLRGQEQNLFGLGSNNTSRNAFLDEARALTLDHASNLWVGTKEGHLYCYSPDWELLHHITHLPSGRPLGAIYAPVSYTHLTLPTMAVV